MKVWKVIGYIFACLGTLFFVYGFFVAFTDIINPATAMLMGSSGPSMESFFSLFLSAIAPWVILASVMFVIGGVGLYAGRNRKTVKLSTDQEDINARLDRLEKTIETNFEVFSKRLDVIEEQQKRNNQK